MRRGTIIYRFWTSFGDFFSEHCFNAVNNRFSLLIFWTLQLYTY